VFGAVCFALAWYLVNRIVVAPSNVLQLHTFEEHMSQDIQSASSELRIGTYNIASVRGTPGGFKYTKNWKGGDRQTRLERLRAITQLVKDIQLDVLVLNEVDFSAQWSGYVNQAEFIARGTGFPYLLEQRDFDFSMPCFAVRSGNAVLSKFPISDVQLVEYPSWTGRVKTTIWEYLACKNEFNALCTIKLSENESFRLLAVHLPGGHNIAARNDCAKDILDICGRSEVPLIAAGDFNSIYYSADLKGKWSYSAISRLLDDGYFSSLPDRIPTEDDMTIHSLKPRGVIDWILVPKPWKMISRLVPQVTYSDHRPVFAVISTEQQEEDNLPSAKPQVVEALPANGATNVDPSVKEIRLTFDLPMQEETSWTGLTEFFPAFPQDSTPHWTDNQKTLVLPVELKPNWCYQMCFSCFASDTFKSRSGVDMDIMDYSFTTGDSDSETPKLENLARTASVRAHSERRYGPASYGPASLVNDGFLNTWWWADVDDTNTWIEFNWETPQKINRVHITEHRSAIRGHQVLYGERLKKVSDLTMSPPTADASANHPENQWNPQKIPDHELTFKTVTTTTLRYQITKTTAPGDEPNIFEIEVFFDPELVKDVREDK